MSEITIAKHLLFPLIFSAGIIVIAFLFRSQFISKKYFKSFWISGVVFFIIYGLFIGLAAYDDLLAQIEFNKFDLDKNGIFTPEERSATGYNEAERHLINDTAIVFAPIFSFILSTMISIPILIIGLLIEKLKKK